MPIQLFYALDFLLLLSCAIAPRLRSSERRVSLSLLQIQAALPLLAAQYFYAAHNIWIPDIYLLLLYTESLFMLLWLTMAMRLSAPPSENRPKSPLVTIAQLVTGAALTGLVCYYRNQPPEFQTVTGALVSDPYGVIYFQALFFLLTMLAAAWRIELFWRRLSLASRWSYKFLVMGSFLTTAALIWAASYRLTYQRLSANHLALLGSLILISWLLILYAVARHRLLNRKMFISRKIIYAFVAPTIFAVYILALGIVGLLMRTFGLPLPFVLQWLALTLGLLAVGIFLFSPDLRRRAHFFISTHFYINKYEYRDEWLALSTRLQNAATETQVVMALYEVLAKSLYATRIIIWTGDNDRGYIPMTARSSNPPSPEIQAIGPDDPLVHYLKTHPYFHSEDNITDTAYQTVAIKKASLLGPNGIILLAPLHTGDQLLGIIGIGPEFTGGRYGHDDFDLLAALGTQTASALMAVRMAEKLADAREREAWQRLSAFVLHDIKNAAAMLSLVRANAPANIHNPEFQQDMLEAMDDALVRMNKVQTRLDLLKEEITPEWSEIDLQHFMNDRCNTFRKSLKPMTIQIDCPPGILIRTDPQFLSRILENLLINACESGHASPAVHIETKVDPDQPHVAIRVRDNGPGIDPALLPDALFHPLKTTKASGSGIGLWQVKQLVTSLNGTIHAENIPGNGAAFTIRLPNHG